MRPKTSLQCFASEQWKSRAKHCRDFLGRVLGRKNKIQNLSFRHNCQHPHFVSSCRSGVTKAYIQLIANCELRKKIRTRTRARTLAGVRCAYETWFETCVRCACVRGLLGTCEVRLQLKQLFIHNF